MSNSEPETAEQLIALLRDLRAQRTVRKDAERRQVRRPRPLSTLERQQVYAKTAGNCHICGGIVDKRWQADHVLARSGGGSAEADNYLAAHRLCNNYRWDYLSEEFQIILKLGVWVRTQIEKQTVLGEQVASGFMAHEKGRRKRRKNEEF